MRISDWSSDVCSSDLPCRTWHALGHQRGSTTRVQRWRLRSARRPFHAGHPGEDSALPHRPRGALTCLQIGRASCRERVCQYVYISVVAGSLKKKIKHKEPNPTTSIQTLTIDEQ